MAFLIWPFLVSVQQRRVDAEAEHVRDGDGGLGRDAVSGGARPACGSQSPSWRAAINTSELNSLCMGDYQSPFVSLHNSL